MKNIIYILLLFALFSSCENEIGIKNYNWEQKVVMNALFDNLKTPNYVHLFKTGINDIEKIKNASIELYINETLSETAYFKDDSYQFTTAFSAGDKLTLIAKDSNDNIIAKSEDVVPSSPKIESIEIDSVIFWDEYYGYNIEAYRINLTMNDIPTEDNKFRIYVEQRDFFKTINYDSVYYDSTNDSIIYINPSDSIFYNSSTNIIIDRDPVLNDGYGKNDNGGNIMTDYIFNHNCIFSDTHFKNQKVTLTFFAPFQYKYYYENVREFIGTELHIKLHSIREDEFSYMHILNINYSDVLINGLFDPLIYPSNVKPGTGLVGISTSDEKIFYFEAIRNDPYDLFTLD